MRQHPTTETHDDHGPDVPRFNSAAWRIGDGLVAALARLGIGPIHLLTTSGRRTGRSHTKPVVPVDHNGSRWLVAPYGPVEWVQNARTTHAVSLRYGRTTHRYVAREASPREAAPVLKRYLAIATKARPRFSVSPDSTMEEFIAVAPHHPVFELTPAPEDGEL